MENIRVKVLTKYLICVNFAVKVQVSPQLLKGMSKNGRIKEGRGSAVVGLDTSEVIGGHLIELCELDKEVKGYLALAAFVKLVLLAGDAEDLCDFFLREVVILAHIAYTLIKIHTNCSLAI